MLDAWALLAVALGQRGSETTRRTIEAGGTVISWINLGEVYYVLARRLGRERAQVVIDAALADVRAELPDEQLVLAAAGLKARGGVSYSDCFAVATAQRYGAPLLTGDPELVALSGAVQIVDLREAP